MQSIQKDKKRHIFPIIAGVTTGDIYTQVPGRATKPI